jgi:3-oxoacyl-[acyl-carrier-protein] synthase-3
MEHVTIVGTGRYLPENTMRNDDLANLVDTSDAWIISRTGIRERRISNGDTTSDMAYEAGLRAVKSAGMTAGEIDLIICATITPDCFMPSVACMVQGRMGAKKAAAFDVSAACTGFVYAVVTALQFIKSGMYQNALVIGADTNSKILDWEDRSTCVLFGDGAGAVVLSSAEENKKGIMAAVLSSDGTKHQYLSCAAVPLSNPYIQQSEPGFRPSIQMNGQEVFKFAVRCLTESIEILLTESNIKIEDVKYIIPHQANRRIIEPVAKHFNIPLERFYMNLEKYGNTSSGTIGIALDELVQNRQLNQGDKIILVGFGGGMTGGALFMEWG